MTLRIAIARLVCIALASPLALLARDAGQLNVQGAGPYYTVALPLDLRSQSSSPDLSDLRVMGANGEPLPFAWAEPPAVVAEEQAQRIPFLKLPPAPRQPASAAPGSATDVGWMIDARNVKGRLTSLELELPEAASGVYTLALDASDDLQHWQPLQPGLQLVSLHQQGLRIRSTHVDLPGLRAGYLRLRVVAGSAVPALKGVQVRSVRQAWQAPPLQWTEPIAPSECDAHHCDYALPRHVPLEQVQWQLAEVNTLGGVLMLGVLHKDAKTTAAHRHRLSDKLKALRHKTAGAASEPTQRIASWHPIASATLYWLRVGDADVRTAPIVLDGGHYEQIRLQADAAMSLLGNKPPTLRIATRTRSLVFLARGAPPYRLAWADAANSLQTAGAALPLDQLMPTRQAGDALPSDSATVQLPPAMPATAGSAARSAALDVVPSPGRSHPWLWAVLVGGAGLMGAMAWSLLRSRSKP